MLFGITSLLLQLVGQRKAVGELLGIQEGIWVAAVCNLKIDLIESDAVNVVQAVNFPKPFSSTSHNVTATRHFMCMVGNSSCHSILAVLVMKWPICCLKLLLYNLVTKL